MWKKWLSRIDTVRRAETREQREAIYRFRYEIYHQEYGRLLGRPDHQKRWVRDEDDERPTTSLLYTGTPERITSTVRLRHWQPGEVPHHDVEELSMDLFPDLSRRRSAEIGRLMVRPSLRGKLLVASLVRASYQLLVGEKGSELVFCYCSPGLVRFYRRIAMRPYGGRLVNAPDGLMVPLVSVTSDADYYRQTGSYLEPLVGRYFGPGKREAVELEPYRPLFQRPGIALEAGEVHAHCARDLGGEDCRSSAFLSAMDGEIRRQLIDRGLVLDVPEGTLVTRKGFRERELYVVLEGRFEAASTATRSHFRVGDHFGEESLLHDDGRRRISVRATMASRVLILRGRRLEKLLRQQPALEAALRGGRDPRVERVVPAFA